MRTRTWLFVGMIAVAGSSAGAQTTRQMGALAVRDKAPTDKAIDLTDEELVTVAKAMPGQNLATTRLLEGGFYSVNIRRLTGPETAHLHPVGLTIYVIREGSATLVTGGKLVNEKRTNAENLTGTAIEGGSARPVAKGDFIIVPEKTPHWFSTINGTIVLMSFHAPRPVGAH